MHAPTTCGVELVSQHSFGKCTPGKSFGCVNATHAYVRSCRGVFRCTGGTFAGFACGYPPGRREYACACTGTADEQPDDPGAPPLVRHALRSRRSASASFRRRNLTTLGYRGKSRFDGPTPYVLQLRQALFPRLNLSAVPVLPWCASRLRVYVYPLPHWLNLEAVEVMETWKRRSNCDYARTPCTEVHRDDASGYSNYRQYAAEVPLLAKFLSMPQTRNPDAADLFVVPYLDKTYKVAFGSEKTDWDVSQLTSHKGGGFDVSSLLSHLATHRARHIFFAGGDSQDMSKPLRHAATGALLCNLGPRRPGTLDVVVPPNDAGYGAIRPPELLPWEHRFFANMGEVNPVRIAVMAQLDALRRRHPEWQASLHRIRGHRVSLISPTEVTQRMLRSLVCPITDGDLPYQHRLYDALVLGCVPLFVRDNTSVIIGRSWWTAAQRAALIEADAESCVRWYSFPQCMDDILPFWSQLPYAEFTFETTVGGLTSFLEDTPLDALLAKRAKLDGYRRFFWYNFGFDNSTAQDSEDAFTKLIEVLCATDSQLLSVCQCADQTVFPAAPLPPPPPSPPPLPRSGWSRCARRDRSAFEANACCPRACLKCGGPGCETRTGGRAHCCTPEVVTSGRDCATESPPCVFTRA